jgi:citrate lyase beta subunit
MIRSLLFVPGGSRRMIQRAQETEAEALILDLEDAVAPERKEEARQSLAQTLREVDLAPKEVFVRINGLRTPWGLEDARAAVAGGVRGIVIPKVEHPDEVTAIAAVLQGRLHREDDRQRPRILCLIETPRGIFAARTLAESNHLVIGLLFGASDLARALGSNLTEGEPELLYARSHLLLAARAAEIPAYDAPSPAIEDLAAVRRHSQSSRALGYDGKAAIHPAHLPIIHEVFSHTPEEVEEAVAIVEALTAAQAAGYGAALHRGRMIDQVDLAEAQRLLAKIAPLPIPI